MSTNKKKNSHKKKPANHYNPQKAASAANTAQIGEQEKVVKSKSEKAYAPQPDSKPLIVRILVLTLAAVMILGIVVGSVATGMGF
jgi:hypothetical protein